MLATGERNARRQMTAPSLGTVVDMEKGGSGDRKKTMSRCGSSELYARPTLASRCGCPNVGWLSFIDPGQSTRVEGRFFSKGNGVAARLRGFRFSCKLSRTQWQSRGTICRTGVTLLLRLTLCPAEFDLGNGDSNRVRETWGSPTSDSHEKILDAIGRGGHLADSCRLC